MKLNKLALAIAGATMLATGVAEARIEGVSTATTFTGSELVLNVWDQTSESSYSLDLGVFQYEIYANPSAVRSWTLNDANFGSFLGSQAAGDTVVYNVASGASQKSASSVLVTEGPFAGQTKKAASLANWGLLTTLNQTHTLADFQTQLNTATKIGNAISSGVQSTIVNVNGATGQSDLSISTDVDVSLFATVGAPGYAGTGYGSNLNNTLGNLSNAAAIGESLAFVNAYSNSTGSSNLYRQFDNVWTLKVENGVGTLTYAAAVPVPAAAWMFLSGVMGMLAATRRKLLAA